MVRAVLDVNVLISALLSRDDSPARLLRAWQAGRFDLVVCQALLTDVRRALGNPKLARLIAPEDADAFVGWLARTAEVAADPVGPPPFRSADPGDDYLIAMASAERAYLVSGDAHLLVLVDRAPILTPREFIARLG